MRWPLRVRWWKWVHTQLNRLAWRYGLEPGWHQGMWGSALHIRHDHWTWRLQSWAADKWIGWWFAMRLGSRVALRDATPAATVAASSEEAP